MPDRAQPVVLVLAEHDTTLHDTAALFSSEGYAVQTASGEDDIAAWIGSLKPALIAYRLTDPSTRRTVCRTALQAVAAMPGPRTPSVAICEPAEATAAASLCKEGLADDYLILPQLKDDLDRVATVTERLIALRRQREHDSRRSESMSQLWQAFARFDSELPVELQQADPDSRTAQSLAALRTSHHRVRSRMTQAPVLVVEDDPDFQSLLKTLIGALKQPAVGASDANDALGWLEKHEPALILLDFRMPGRDGASFLEEIRKAPKFRQIPVIMLTGHSSVDTVQRARKLGVADFIVKPSDPPTIMKKIAAFL